MGVPGLSTGFVYRIILPTIPIVAAGSKPYMLTPPVVIRIEFRSAFYRAVTIRGMLVVLSTPCHGTGAVDHQNGGGVTGSGDGRGSLRGGDRQINPVGVFIDRLRGLGESQTIGGYCAAAASTPAIATIFAVCSQILSSGKRHGGDQR